MNDQVTKMLEQLKLLRLIIPALISKQVLIGLNQGLIDLGCGYTTGKAAGRLALSAAEGGGGGEELDT